MRQILFTNLGTCYGEPNTDHYIFLKSTIKNNHLKTLDISYKYGDEYVTTSLSKSILYPCNMAYKMDDMNINHFMDGYMAYIALFFLLDKVNFKNLLPFKFVIPCSLENGDCCDYNMLQYMYYPLSTMLKIVHHLPYHYFNTVTYFIKTYRHLFHAGPSLNPMLMNELNMNIIEGLSTLLKPVCNGCQCTYKEDKIICHVCQYEFVLGDDPIKCLICHKMYHECQHPKFNVLMERKLESFNKQMDEKMSSFEEMMTQKISMCDEMISQRMSTIEEMSQRITMMSQSYEEMSQKIERIDKIDKPRRHRQHGPELYHGTGKSY